MPGVEKAARPHSFRSCAAWYWCVFLTTLSPGARPKSAILLRFG